MLNMYTFSYTELFDFDVKLLYSKSLCIQNCRTQRSEVQQQMLQKFHFFKKTLYEFLTWTALSEMYLI